MRKLACCLFALFALLGALVAQTNNARMLSGVNYQTGTSYTFVAADATRITSFSNGSSIAATLPAGSTTGFGQGFVFSVVNTGTGTLSINCSGCTISGAGSLSLTQNQSADIYSDGANYVAARGSGSGGGTAGAVLLAPSGAQNLVQPVSGTGTTPFNVNNQSNLRWVTPAFNWSYTDSGGSLGNLASAGTNLTITLPCTGGAPCPEGIDASGGFPFQISGTVSMSNGSGVVTETGANFFTNYVGLPVTIAGCGSGSSTLLSTIVSWQSSTQVTIATPAGTNCSGQVIKIATYVYQVYISGTGTAEAVPVLGGTCTPGATASCTLIVSTAFAHPNGYTISSASTGIQEAINDAFANNSATGAAGLAAPSIKLMAGTNYNVYGTFVLRGFGSRIDADGALVTCFTRDFCGLNGEWDAHPAITDHSIKNLLMTQGATAPTGCSATSYCTVSSVAASSGVITVTTSANHSFRGPTNGVGADYIQCEIYTTGQSALIQAGRIQAVTSNTFTYAIDGAGTFSAGTQTFGFCRILETAWEDNGDHTVFDNFQLVNTINSGFGFGITDENDQHLVVRAASNRGSGQVIDVTYPVGAFFYQRTDRGYGGIMVLSDVELTGVNCFTAGSGANGLTWSGGNVCQGSPVFGVRYPGGLQPLSLENIYQETASNANNPLYGGIVAMGYEMGGGLGGRILGTFPTGGTFGATFSCTGGSGNLPNKRNYYVVGWNGASPSPMFYIGSSATTNCSGATINVTWPMFNISTASGAITWTLYVTSGTGTVPPTFSAPGSYCLIGNGSGGSAAPTLGSNGMLTYSDTQGATASCGAPTPTYASLFWFWPYPFVCNGAGCTIFADIASKGSTIASSSGIAATAIVALRCVNAGAAQEQMSPTVVKCLDTNGGVSDTAGGVTFIQQSTANTQPPLDTKGLINFGPPIGSHGDLLTLEDSNSSKTFTTLGFRPSNDAQDTAICKDQGNGVASGLCFRANTSVSVYIGAIADNSSFLERLTSSAKLFAVPLAASGTAAGLSGTGACSTRTSQTGGSWSGSVTCTGTTGASTLVITPGGTATNGWACSGSDTTSGHELAGAQSGSSTTTCTLKFSSVTSSDVLTFTANRF